MQEFCRFSFYLGSLTFSPSFFRFCCIHIKAKLIDVTKNKLLTQRFMRRCASHEAVGLWQDVLKILIGRQPTKSVIKFIYVYGKCINYL